jgi:aspartate aminotransferase
MRLADWMSRLGTETAFEVLAKARALEAQGKDIVHLEVGEPDFDTPAHIRERAKRAIDAGLTHYGPGAGIGEARAAVAEHVAKTRGVPVDPEEVLITPGGKPVITFSILALVDPGDEVIYPNPGFPIYESLIRFVGAKAVPLPLREANDFAADMDELEKLVTPKTKLLILNSPGNPTGSVLGPADLERIAALAKKNPGMWILSDEIYSRIVYEGRHHSILSLPGMKERVILLDGFSKAYAMTGWRMGYGVAPRALVNAMAKLGSNFHSCTPAFTQLAAVEALTGPQDDVVNMVAEFRRRREAIVKALSGLPGFTCKTPKAAFYVFPNVKATGKTALELSDFFLKEAGVACLSGTCFGSEGEGYLRFSYANSIANIEKGVKRMGEALARLPEKARR